MLGYTGSVVAWSAKDANGIYQGTMSAAEQAIPRAVYNEYKSNPLSAEPRAFVQQLPTYKIKPLYDASMWLVHAVTKVSLPAASWCISATCFALLSALLFFWRPHYMTRDAWLIIVIGLTYLWPWSMDSLARFSTPDCVATLLTMGALYSWIERRSFSLFCVFSWFAILARPDALILCGSLAVYFAVAASQEFRISTYRTIVLLGVLTATYLTLSRFAGDYGWERLFIFSFIDRTPYPADATDHLTLRRYWDVLVPATTLFFDKGRTIAVALFSAVACLCYYLKPAEDNRLWFHMVVLFWACIVVRFLLYPAWGDDRYYFMYYLPILFGGGELMAAYLKALIKVLQGHRTALQTAS
jgi:hypothetical protein